MKPLADWGTTTVRGQTSIGAWHWAPLRKQRHAAGSGVDSARWDEDRRLLDSTRRVGVVEGFSLGSYAILVDYMGRLFRERKVAISRELAAIFDRLGTTAESWCSRPARLSQGRLARSGAFDRGAIDDIWRSPRAYGGYHGWSPIAPRSERRGREAGFTTSSAAKTEFG